MKTLLMRYPNEGKKLRQVITILLKKNLIQSAEVLNYGKHYTLLDNKIVKTEQKMVVFSLEEDKVEAFLSFLKKLEAAKDLIMIGTMSSDI